VRTAAASALAFTGQGPGTTWIAIAGVALLLVGVPMLAIAGAPSRLRRRMARSFHRSS
jgi:hypothetical protein